MSFFSARYGRRKLIALAGLGAGLACSPVLAAPTGVQVSGWARPTVTGQSSAVAYLTVRNYGPGSDELIGISSPAAAKAGIHRSQIIGGVARMRPAGAIVIPPGKMLTMAPGGLHVMLMGLKAPLKPNATLTLTVKFKHGGARQLRLPIEMSPPDDRPHQH